MKSKSMDSQLSIAILNVFESTSNQKLWRNEIFIFVKFTCFLHIEKKMYIKGFMNHVVTVLKIWVLSFAWRCIKMDCLSVQQILFLKHMVCQLSFGVLSNIFAPVVLKLYSKTLPDPLKSAGLYIDLTISSLCSS